MLSLMRLLEARNALDWLVARIAPLLKPFGLTGLGVFAALQINFVSFAAPIATLAMMEQRGTSDRHLAATLAMVFAMAQANASLPMLTMGLELAPILILSLLGGLTESADPDAAAESLFQFTGLGEGAMPLALTLYDACTVRRGRPGGVLGQIVALAYAYVERTAGVAPGFAPARFVQAVAAAVSQGPLQASDFHALGLTLRIQAFDLCIEPGRILRQQAKAALQQLTLEPREVGPQRLAPVAPVLDFGHQRLVALTVLDQRRQQRDLALGLEHRLMGAVEVIEVADQRLDAAGDVEGLQHVAAHEVGEVAHRFHRYRLVEQLQRLLVFDTEASPKPRPVRRKAVEQFTTTGTQAPSRAPWVISRS